MAVATPIESAFISLHFLIKIHAEKVEALNIEDVILNLSFDFPSSTFNASTFLARILIRKCIEMKADSIGVMSLDLK